MATQDSTILQTIALLMCYGFEIKGQTSEEIVNNWLTKYTPSWLRLATIEALYLGRYKAISVEQILSIWLRKGSPAYHFNHDFERLICRKLPLYLQSINSAPAENNRKNSNLNGNGTKKSLQFATPIANSSRESKQKYLKTANSQYKNSEVLTIYRENLTKESDIVAEKTSPEPVKIETKTIEGTESNTKPAYKQNWLFSTSDRSIDRFMPIPDRSQFYLKLKDVARKNSQGV